MVPLLGTSRSWQQSMAAGVVRNSCNLPQSHIEVKINHPRRGLLSSASPPQLRRGVWDASFDSFQWILVPQP